MYAYLTEEVKRRFIMELRNYWSHQPNYPDLPDNIQNKYSFKERVQYGIVLKSSSASPVQLSSDNFQGTIVSYVQLSKFEDKPGTALEWVWEDDVAIIKNGGRFPSPPGIYYVRIFKADENIPEYSLGQSYEFYVDPLLEVFDQLATKVSDLVYAVQRPYLANTMIVVEMPGAIPYVRDVNFFEEPSSGRIRLKYPLPSGTYLQASYKYPVDSIGPTLITPNNADKDVIPGVILAFGKKLQDDDVCVVRVSQDREPTADEFGGRWTISLDFDIFARDPYSQQEIADETLSYLWGVARSRLSSEGIEIRQVSMGGESEEAYDENGDDYFYTATLSVEVESDWSIHVPILSKIRRVTQLTSEETRALAEADPTIASPVQSNIEVVDPSVPSFPEQDRSKTRLMIR